MAFVALVVLCTLVLHTIAESNDADHEVFAMSGGAPAPAAAAAKLSGTTDKADFAAMEKQPGVKAVEASLAKQSEVWKKKVAKGDAEIKNVGKLASKCQPPLVAATVR